MEVTPDRAGFVEAQERLRRLLGESVVLLGPVQATWPPGTALDPELGRPFNPLITPSASAQASAEIHGRVAFRGVPTGDQAPEDASPIGFIENADVAVIAGSGVASAASGAVGMIVRGERYEIRQARFDGIAGIERYLIFGSKEG